MDDGLRDAYTQADTDLSVGQLLLRSIDGVKPLGSGAFNHAYDLQMPLNSGLKQDYIVRVKQKCIGEDGRVGPQLRHSLESSTALSVATNIFTRNVGQPLLVVRENEDSLLEVMPKLQGQSIEKWRRQLELQLAVQGDCLRSAAPLIAVQSRAC